MGHLLFVSKSPPLGTASFHDYNTRNSPFLSTFAPFAAHPKPMYGKVPVPSLLRDFPKQLAITYDTVHRAVYIGNF